MIKFRILSRHAEILYYIIIISLLGFVSLTVYPAVPLLDPAKIATDVVAPEDDKAVKPPRTFAVGFQVGLLGPMGFELNLKIKSNLSLVPGFGGWRMDEALGNSSQLKEETNMCLLLRYGRSIYAGAGFVSMKRRYIARQDNISAGGEAKSSGIPFLAGFELASKKGSFLRGEAGCIYYLSRDETRYYSLGSWNFPLEAPGNAQFSGITIGRYLK